MKDIMWLTVPAVAYLAQAGMVYAAAGRWGMALAFFSYAVGNVGFMLDVKGI